MNPQLLRNPSHVQVEFIAVFSLDESIIFGYIFSIQLGSETSHEKDHSRYFVSSLLAI
jgi:hypothetical protein